MAQDIQVSSEFYWDNIVFKVEDTLFCVPRCGFVHLSEVFADMFILPSGPATCTEGQDREHPIVLEGYNKDEFASLLKVMYPTAGSLISDEKFELRLEKNEWVNVLKLSTIWGMRKIRQYAIHKLSTDTSLSLSPIEKFLLARAHRVPAWLIEAVTCLTSDNPKPTLDDLATLGWETAARILWIRDNSSHSITASNILCFRREAIKCGSCSSPASLINTSHGCGHIASADAELTFPGPGTPTSGPTEHLVTLRMIQCKICGANPFCSTDFFCGFCSRISRSYGNVRITLSKVTLTAASREMIGKMFGEEIKDYELSSTMTAA